MILTFNYPHESETSKANINDESVRLFCQEERLSPPMEETGSSRQDVLKINDIFSIYFGKPNIAEYLVRFSKIYSNR